MVVFSLKLSKTFIRNFTLHTRKYLKANLHTSTSHEIDTLKKQIF